MHCKYTGYWYTLLLAAGKFIRTLFSVFIHAYNIEALVNSLPDFLRWHSHVFRAKTNILFDNCSNYLVVGILENHAGSLPDIPQIPLIPRVFAINQYSSFRRMQNRIDMFCKGWLTGAVMPEYCDKIALLYRQINIIYSTCNSVNFAVFISSYIVKY